MTWSLDDLRAPGSEPVGSSEVVYAFVSLEGEPSGRDESLLDDDERVRAGRFVHRSDARRFVLAHAALRLFLASSIGVDPRAVRYENGEHGKPRLVPQLVPAPAEFNLSHSGEIALMAITRAGALGVDVERERELPDALIIAEKYFSVVEGAALRGMPEIERPGAFFRCWTRKEAVIKADGGGLGVPLDSFDVDLAPGSLSALKAFRHRPTGEGEWSLRDLTAPAGYAAAGAIRVPVSGPTQWRELVSAVRRASESR